MSLKASRHSESSPKTLSFWSNDSGIMFDIPAHDVLKMLLQLMRIVMALSPGYKVSDIRTTLRKLMAQRGIMTCDIDNPLKSIIVTHSKTGFPSFSDCCLQKTFWQYSI